MKSERDLSRAVWRKSSHSGSGNGAGAPDCLQVADNIRGVVPVRDSKATGRPPLVFPAPAWAAFVSATASAPVSRPGDA
ncbi:DUF397 domain-containing protein [Streptomyces luteireticuli]|uniref:DUF397 domain-containing protein n=1 Tax=Streptomyces luteireticuli TaxID=173858 RepID=A0ABN0Z3K8_9ACTN